MANRSEKIREAILRLLGDVERKTEADVRPLKMEVGGHRKIGRPKLRWINML